LEKEKDTLRNHRYFAGEEKEEKFYFTIENKKYLYVIDFNGSIEKNFPIRWGTDTVTILEIWDTHDWFKQLYTNVNEIYFQRNRIRMITNNIKRSIQNTLFFTCVGEDKGEELYKMMYKINQNRMKRIDKKYLPLLYSFKEKLEHERYCVSIKEENRSSVLFRIY